MSNPETTETGSDLLVSASVCVVGVLAEALAQHNSGFIRDDGDWQCSKCGAVEVVDYVGALARHQASVVAALPNIAIIKVPSVGYKAQGETDAQRYSTIATRIENNYAAGGSNSRAAVAELLRRVSTSLTARAEGVQA